MSGSGKVWALHHAPVQAGGILGCASSAVLRYRVPFLKTGVANAKWVAWTRFPQTPELQLMFSNDRTQGIDRTKHQCMRLGARDRDPQYLSTSMVGRLITPPHQ